MDGERDDLRPLGGDLAAAMARLRRAAESPEHMAAVARREADLARIHRGSLVTSATVLEIPAHESLRAVALDEEPRETRALTVVREVLEGRAGRRVGTVVVLTGPPGSGKSSACAWGLLRCGEGALWVSAPEVAAMPRNGFSENEHRWQRWLSVPVVVLDDLGTETGDPEVLSALLCARIDRGLLTLASTNLDLRDFSGRYFAGPTGARLLDRLRGQKATGRSWFVATEAQSLRGGRQ